MTYSLGTHFYTFFILVKDTLITHSCDPHTHTKEGILPKGKCFFLEYLHNRSNERSKVMVESFWNDKTVTFWRHEFSFFVFCPQLIQLQSYRRQRMLYFKGHLGLQNCCITEICSWRFCLRTSAGPVHYPT